MSDDQTLNCFKRGKGRPTKFDQEIANKILTLIRSGNYIEPAAAAAGLHKATFYAWLKKGAKAGSGPFKDFNDAVVQAVAHAEALDVSIIGKAAQNGDWRASAWRLERRNPKRWGRKDQIEIGKINFDEMSDEELAAIASGDNQNTED